MKRACLDTDMDSASRHWHQGLLLLTAVLALIAETARGEILYDNTQNPAANNHFKVNKGIEIGDEVLLNVQAPVILTHFAFEYYGLNFSGNEQARLRFYQMNQLYHFPEALIFDSGWIGISPAPEGTTLPITDFITGAAVPLTNHLSVDFIWSVEFQGIETSEQVGLLTSEPFNTAHTLVVLVDGHCFPAPLNLHLQRITNQNQHFTLFWRRFSHGWERIQALDVNQIPISVNFLARIEGEAAEDPPISGEGTPLMLSLRGDPGSQYQIQTSTDLTQWTELTTETATSRGLSVPVSATNGCQFYRALLMR